ncbi:succinate dehydrogenase assembly factor 4, mitochondrial-like [Ptychodera flava]|uniref:succinate dehydrogenase assembly factor 4, mitochondrial-like n=1 Tax=Ptychodera flava TaxID=63121 RepID=UPI00396A3E40
MASLISRYSLTGMKKIISLQSKALTCESIARTIPVPARLYSDKKKDTLKKPVTPVGKHDSDPECNREWPVGQHPYGEKEPLERWPDNVNPHTGEIGGPRGPEPTRYGDWERKGRCIDF